MRIRALLAGAVVALPFALPAPAHAAQPLTWHLSQIRIGQSQAAGRYGAGITVAVVDTWVDATHPDLGGRVVGGADCSGGSCQPGSAPADKCDAHGTHVSGTIASTTYGIAPKARIMPLRVLKWDGKECTGRSGDIAAAIRYAIGKGVPIVNVSLGAAESLEGQDATLDAAVREAARAGVLVVFAAGNQNLPVEDSYGGDALIVAATDRRGRLASYSQYGDGVDLAAPGGEAAANGTCTEAGCVLSTWSDEQFAYLSGTSMAAPHVSGVAALLMAQRSRTRDDVVARLRSTAHPVTGAGNGLIDAAAALGVSATPPSAAAAPRQSQPAVLTRTQPPAPRPPTTRAVPPKPAPVPKKTVKPKPRRTAKPKPSPTAVPEPTRTVQVVQPPLAATGSTGGGEPSRAVPAGIAALLVLATGAGVVRRAQL